MNTLTKTTERTNEDWVTALAAGDVEAAGELTRRLRRNLGRALGRRADVDDADLDDFTQDAVVRVIERLDSFRGDSRFLTWATAVAVRVALTAVRRRGWRQASLDALRQGGDGAAHALDPAAETGGTGDGADPAATADRADLLGSLERAIRERLTDRQRTVIEGALRGKPFAVLADELGSNSNALYKVYHDARKKLRAALEAAGFGEDDVRDVVRS